MFKTGFLAIMPEYRVAQSLKNDSELCVFLHRSKVALTYYYRWINLALAVSVLRYGKTQFDSAA